MALFRRRRAGTLRGADSSDLAHLEEFARTRPGVEAYVEPRTTVTETTVALVAATGEWTRRRVEGEKAAADLGRRLGIPVYDVAAVGYPQRMREWTRRRKEEGQTGVPGLDGPSV
ncbi:MAG: oxidoreductase [Mycobacteriales bacterium]